MPKDSGKLNAKRDRFCLEYLRDLDAAAAYRRAGYSAKGAKQSARYLLTIPGISARIQALQDERAHRTRLNLDAVVAELALLAFSNALDYAEITPDGSAKVDLGDLTREQAAAITEIVTTTSPDGGRTVKIKLADKKGALELLGRHFGGFPSRHEHAGPGGGPIQTLGVHVELTDIERRQRILQLMAKGIEAAAEKSNETP